MERYKLPAGRLVTIFYTGNPSIEVAVTSSSASGEEKGTTDPDVPPQTTTVVAEDDAHTETMSSHDGRTLSWKNITLELKTQGEVKRLLDGLSGKLTIKLASSPWDFGLTGLSLTGFAEPGQLTALMGASGAEKVSSTKVLRAWGGGGGFD